MQHRRPNGEWTDDPALAFGEWDALAKPFKDLGLEVIGYDPGILMYDPQKPNSIFDMPTHVAQRIADALTANAEVSGADTASAGLPGSAAGESENEL